MRQRHRTPLIFSLSMVDVLCCALGCIILMWIINLRKAQQGETLDAQLKKIRSQLALAETDRDSARKSVLDLRTQFRLTREEMEKLRALLASTEKERDVARQSASDLRKRRDALDVELTRRLKEMEDLEKRLGTLAKEATALKEEVRTSKTDNKGLAARADELARKLRAAEASIEKLEEQAKLVPGLEKELKASLAKLGSGEKVMLSLKEDLARRLAELTEASKRYEALMKARLLLAGQLDEKTKDLAAALVYKDKLANAEKKQLKLEDLLYLRARELREATESMTRLEGEKRKLRDEADRARSAIDNRFAGIELRGKHIIFLIDTSGSMERVDENTPSLTKWGEVRNTVAKVMRSLPDLEKFQVIAFAEQTRYVLGKEGEWINYDPRTSPQQVLEALAKINPKDGTDMHKALSSAFGYRARGLDTIYIFSDGLPNEGEGLTETQKQIKDMQQRSALLGQFIRRKMKQEWNRPLTGKPRVRINAVGFFFESPDLGSFLWALARENEGSFVGMSRP